MNKEKTAKVEKEPSNVYSIYESNKEFRDAAKRLAAIYEESAEKILEQTAKACKSFAEQVGQILENITLYAEQFKGYVELQGVRPPVEIKKELKHEKNPMRRKQLNRELTESYKHYKRK